MSNAFRRLLLVPICGLLLSGCEQLGLEDPAKEAAAREAEGRAIGGACRHSGRALEDCYKLNARASKAAIFAGWRDMDTYMRENNIPTIPPGGRQGAAAEPAPAVKDSPPEAAPAKKPEAAKSSAAPPPGLSAAGRKAA